MTQHSRYSWTRGSLVAFVATGILANACGSDPATPGAPLPPLVVGQTDFESAPPAGASVATGSGVDASASTGGTGNGSGGTASGPQPIDKGGESADTSAEREIEETDLYRLDG